MTSTLSLEVGVLLLAASFSVVRGKVSLHDHNNIRFKKWYAQFIAFITNGLHVKKNVRLEVR